jgi:hypothetical protein
MEMERMGVAVFISCKFVKNRQSRQRQRVERQFLMHFGTYFLTKPAPAFPRILA